MSKNDKRAQAPHDGKDGKEATELAIGMRGKLGKDAFELVGRAHVASRGGGHWNEWRAVFASRSGGQREGWLAEAAGRFYFMFEAPLLDVDVPPPGALVNARWVIGERDQARRVAIYGDVAPLEDEPHDYRYVDLSGPDGKVGTVDYGDLHPRTFVGRKVSLAELSLAPAREPVYGKVAIGEKPDSELAVGTTVSLKGSPFKILATVVRSSPDDEDPDDADARFSWLEHLLYRKGQGLSWLVELPEEYRLVEQVEAGAVEIRDGAARYGGATWKKTHSGVARTDGAWGALPWVPRIGEESLAIDYEHKDRGLSVEQNDREVAWAVSTPLDEDEVVYAPDHPAAPTRGRTPARK